jgi:hypothetical protein
MLLVSYIELVLNSNAMVVGVFRKAMEQGRFAALLLEKAVFFR